jgi:hypothetical protein
MLRLDALFNSGRLTGQETKTRDFCFCLPSLSIRRQLVTFNGLPRHTLPHTHRYSLAGSSV